MPIGKNAIKRVTNNGYSKVKATAPDMENSTVAEEKKELVIEKPTTPKPSTGKDIPKAKAEPKAKKKVAEKAAPKKSMETEPELAPVKTFEKVIEKSRKATQRQGEGYVNLGGELPYYLL